MRACELMRVCVDVCLCGGGLAILPCIPCSRSSLWGNAQGPLAKFKGEDDHDVDVDDGTGILVVRPNRGFGCIAWTANIVVQRPAHTPGPLGSPLSGGPFLGGDSLPASLPLWLRRIPAESWSSPF